MEFHHRSKKSGPAMKWNHEQIPDQTGRLAIVTGANSGIGYAAARELAHKGARVILACRSAKRGGEALAKLQAESPSGSVALSLLDLSSLDSVRDFADRFLAANDKLDLLINNAGVMMPPKRAETSDGFELQIGVNHLGHFALTGRLLDVLARTPGARVVSVSSLAHGMGTMNFDDLHWQSRKYKRTASYGQSKLANLLFTFELERRLEAAGIDAMAVAAHPGWTATNLQRDTPVFRFLNGFLAMKTEQGALPTLRAAVDPEASGGDYFGPSGFMEARGYPERVDTKGRAKKLDDAAKLWAMSEQLTGVRFESLGTAS